VRSFFAIAFFLLAPVWALSYTEAIGLAKERAPVASAREELANAEQELRRLKADPQVLRMDLLRARQRVVLADAQLRLENVRAVAEISLAYTQLLDAESGFHVAKLGLELAERALKVARLRFAKGGISRQALHDAELRYNDAYNAVRRAEEARSLSRTQLASLIGVVVQAQDLEQPGAPVVLSLNMAYSSLLDHPDRIRFLHAVELAETALALLDPSYASKSRIEEARLQLVQARDGLSEVERALELQAKSRWQDVSARRRAAAIARERDRKAERDLQIALERYKLGLISQIELLQIRFERAQVALEAQNAEHSYLDAAWKLAVAIAQPLEVEDEF